MVSAQINQSQGGVEVSPQGTVVAQLELDTKLVRRNKSEFARNILIYIFLINSIDIGGIIELYIGHKSTLPLRQLSWNFTQIRSIYVWAKEISVC